MSTITWAGTTDNWDTAGNWSPTTKPTSNDVVIIPGTSSQGIQTGITDENGIDLDALIIEEGYSQNIGASGNMLYISSDLVMHYGSGELWYKDGDGTTDLMIIACATPTTVVTLSAAAITRLIVLRGAVTVDGAGTVTNCEVRYINNPLTDATVTFATGSGTCGELVQWGGKVTAANTITAAHCNRGTLTKTGTTSITTLYSGPEHRCIYNSTGTITTAYVAGTLDLMQSGGAKTITTLYRYPGGRVRINETTGVHTVTTPWDLAKRFDT